MHTMLDLMSPLYERISSVLGRIGDLCLLLPYSWHKSLSTYHARRSVARFAAKVAADSEKLRIAGKELEKAENIAANLALTTNGNKRRAIEMLEITGEQIKQDFAKNIADE